LEEINELYEATQQTLIELELKPKDNELQRALFRSIHTIKGDLGLVNFSPLIPLIPLIPLLQYAEDLLDYLRKGQIKYTSNMSNLVLLIMNKVKVFMQSGIQTEQAEYDKQMFERLVEAIKRISPENNVDHEQLLACAVLILEPSLGLILDLGPEQDNAAETLAPNGSSSIATTGIPKTITAEEREDLVFFRELMKPIEKRSMYWDGRGDKIAKLAGYINKIVGSPINEVQFAVACYMHDFGMTFMPVAVLHK
jgi:chemotaxis protein histidine kinase CheA